MTGKPFFLKLDTPKDSLSANSTGLVVVWFALFGSTTIMVV